MQRSFGRRSVVVTLSAAVVALGLMTSLVRAEIPDLTPDKLASGSSHVVSGIVNQVYSVDVKPKDGEKATEVTHLYLTELLVDTVEKGSGPSKGEVVYVRSEKIQLKVGAVGGSGHRMTPEVGSKVRVYLKRQSDGRYDVLLPNGFEVLGAEKK